MAIGYMDNHSGLSALAMVVQDFAAAGGKAEFFESVPESDVARLSHVLFNPTYAEIENDKYWEAVRRFAEADDGRQVVMVCPGLGPARRDLRVARQRLEGLENVTYIGADGVGKLMDIVDEAPKP
jgi:hypothetical protein